MSETISAVASFMAGFTALVIALAALASAGKGLRKRDRETDDRVDVLWAALTRRGDLKARKRGRIIVQKEADMEMLHRETSNALKPIAGKLADIYRRTVRGPDDKGKFTEALEAELGEWIVEFICDKLDVEDFECAAMAYLVARDEVERQDAVHAQLSVF